jgi:hypothetical protein
MKSIWASKTFWVNAVAVGAAVAGVFGFGIDAEFQAEVVVAIMGAVNIALRFVTKEAVKL